MPLFTGDESTPALDDLTVGLSQVLFPIVVLLGLNGLVVGILNAHEHFTIPALAPLVWNLVIIAGLVGLTPLFEGDDQLYALRDRRARRHGRAARDVPAAAAPDRLPAALLVRVPARPARAPGAGADAAGEPRAGADQREPADQLDDRLPRLRGGADRDRRRVPHLHAAAGHVLRRGRDGAVPGAEPARHAPRPGRPAGADRHRDAADRAAADPERGGVRGALDADRAARLRARRVRRRLDPAGERGAVLVLVLAAVLGHRRCCSRAASSRSSARGCRRSSRSGRWRSTRSSRSRSTSRSGSAAS